MSAPKEMASRDQQIKGGNGDFNTNVILPMDVLYEILLRAPARPLCCFRAVCRSWRSLLSDPPFAAAHAARHRGDPPLLAVCAAGEIRLLDMVSGHAVKRVNVTHSSLLQHMVPHQDLVLLHDHDVIGHDRPLRVLDPATGAVSFLPESNDGLSSSFVLGRAVSSIGEDGEYKVLALDRDLGMPWCPARY
ncbi:unnamed protein product [Urochloa humidicola]